MVKRNTAEALRIAKAMRRKGYADGGDADEIVNVAPPLGFIDRLFGKEQPVSYGRATPDQSWPSEAKLDTSRKYDQTYGDPVAPTLAEGAKINRPGFSQVQKAFDEHAPLSAPQEMDQEQRDRLETAWLAANKTALGSLGFDPRNIASTPATKGATSLGGFYSPKNDQAWYNERYPSAVVHESIHRGINKLRDAGKLPDWFKKSDEERFTRGMMLKHFGDIEVQPVTKSGKGNEQIDDARQLMDTNSFYGGSFMRNRGKSFPDMLTELESLAASHLHEQRPRGPRADGGRTGYADGGYPTMEIDPVTGQPRLKAEEGGGGEESSTAGGPSLGGISSSTSAGPSAADPSSGPNASIGVADPSSMSAATAATLAGLQQEEAQAPAAAPNPYGELAGISQGPPAPSAQAPAATPAAAPAAPMEPAAPPAANPYGGLANFSYGPPAPAPGSTPGVQAAQSVAPPPFATPDQLQDNPDITGATPAAQEAAAQADAEADAAAAAASAPDGTIGGASYGEGAWGGGFGSEGAFGGGPEGSAEGSSSEGSAEGGNGGAGADGGGADGGGGDGGGGDGGGGGEKRGGLVRLKRRASGGMVDQALKIANIHGRKLKSQAKKDGSVVKQAVVLASKLAKRQRGRP
jgi:hypothetical protein